MALAVLSCLTAFKTILLDPIVTVISACIKKSSKLVNFCVVAMSLLKMEQNTEHFRHLMLYYFKKGKNATEMQKKICAVYGEGAVTDVESGL